MAARRKRKAGETFEKSKRSPQGANIEKDKEETAVAPDESEGDSTEFECEDTQTTRTTRGRTRLEWLSRQRVRRFKKNIRFNKLGQPVGEAAAEMQSYIGVLAREKVKITYKSWKQVPRDVKEWIWESVNLAFNVDPGWKKGCLSSANAKWRQYKTQLTQNFILKNRNNPEELKKPPTGFGIPPADWSSFVNNRISEDFIKLSDQQKERRKHNIHPHRLSRKGYARLAEEIADELCDDEEVNRAILWKKGRANKEGEFDGDDLITTVEKIDDYIQQKQEGKLTFEGPKEDVLTKALDSEEHAGRVRGVGGHVTPTMYFNVTRVKRHVEQDLMNEQQKELMEVKKKLSEQDARIKKLEAMVYKTGARDIENVERGSCFVELQHPMNEDDIRIDKSFSNDEDFDDDVQFVDKADALQGKPVALTLESSNNIVAHGTIISINAPGNRLHGAPLPKNCMRISIDQALDESAPLPIPIPSECDNIGDALGTHVAWPVHLIKMQNEKPSRSKSGHQQKKPTLSSDVPRSLRMLYCYCKHALKNGDNIPVCLDNDVFGDDCELYVHLEDIIPFCELEPISCNCIIVYIWHLYKRMKEENKLEKFRFVNPYEILDVPTTKMDKSSIDEQLQKRARVLADRLSGASTDQLVLVPCNIGYHWILTVIDPYKEVVFSLDPLSHRNHDKNWKYVVNLALKLFNANKGRKGRKQPIWEVVQGPRQPDAKQCGFYVMRYMRQITEEVANINKASLRSIVTKGEYSRTEIDEVRSEWAECLQDHIHE